MARSQFRSAPEETQTPLYRIPVAQEATLNPVVPTFHKAAQKTTQKLRRRRRLSHGFKKRFALATVLVVGGITGRWIYANQEPLWPQTATAKPFVARYDHNSMLGPNAGHFYAAAADALHVESASALSGLGKDEKIPLAELRETVAKNATALKLLREGFDYTYQGTNTYAMKGTAPLSLSSPSPNFIAQRSLARLLATDAYLKSLAGDHLGAVTTGLEIQRFGNDIGHGDRLIEAMIGNMVQDLGLKTALAYAGQLTPAEAEAALKQLDALPAPLSYTEALQQGKKAELADLQGLFQDITRGGLHPNVYSAAVWWYGKQELVNRVAGYYDQHLSRAGLTVEQRQQLPKIARPTDAITEIMLPDLHKIQEILAKSSDQRTALRSQLEALSRRRR